MRSLLLTVILTTALLAQDEGNIRGIIRDAGSGDPLIGANVLVKGTYYGATSDDEGFFLISGVEAGEYTLEVSYIGYRVIQRTGVGVIAGQSITLNFDMSSTPLALGQDVEVIGERPLMDLEETSTVRSLNSEDIANSIVSDASDLISQQVGVVEQDNEIHIRGGRTYEAQYLLDGISVQDPLSGTGFGLNISANAIEEIEVITGGFKAEFGQATSGIVNVKTRSGGNSYEAYFTYKNDHLGLFKDNDFSFNSDHYEFNLGGPEPFSDLLSRAGLDLPGDLYFFMNFYASLSDDFTGATSPQLRSSITPTLGGLLDETSFAPRQDNNWSGLLKLTWKISPIYTLTYSYNRSILVNQNTQSLQTNLEYVEPNPGFPYDFSKNLANFNTYTHDNEQISLTWLHTLNKTTFYELRFSKYFAQLRSDWDGQHWTEYRVPLDVARLPVEYYSPDSQKVRVIPGDGFYDFGNAFFWHDHFVDWFTFKGDVTSLIGDIHRFKAGFELSFKEMQLVEVADPWLEGGFGSSQDIYRVHPADGAFYVQDDIKFQGFFLDAGVRLDWWMPGTVVDRAVLGPESVFSEELQQQYESETAKLFGNHFKLRLMPRLGVSHPVSNNLMLYFNYGHFSKLPRPQFVYAKIGPSRFTSAFQKFGNPTLDPETSVKYELGVRYKLTEDDVVSVNAYYKDIFDYIQTVPGINIRRGISGTTYLNLDYARARGIEAEYKTRVGRFLSGNISASYSITTTKSSSADDGILFDQGLLQELPIKETFARWDRPWQISFNLAIDVPAGQNPEIFGLKLFSNWHLNFRYFTQAGRRYTPAIFSHVDQSGRPIYNSVIDQSLQFSELGGLWQWADISFTKYFSVFNLEYGVFAEIKNVFNHQNPAIINPVTGDAYHFGDPVPSGWNDPLFPDRTFPISSPFPLNPARFRSPRNLQIGFFIEF